MEDESLSRLWFDLIAVLAWLCAIVFVACLLSGARRVHDMSSCLQLARRYHLDVTFEDFCVIHTPHGDVPAEHWIPPRP